MKITKLVGMIFTMPLCWIVFAVMIGTKVECSKEANPSQCRSNTSYLAIIPTLFVYGLALIYYEDPK